VLADRARVTAVVSRLERSETEPAAVSREAGRDVQIGMTNRLAPGPRGKAVNHQGQATSETVYTVRQMCRLLKVSRSTIDRLAEKGGIPGRFKVGQQIRYWKATVDSWLANLSGTTQE
jgi:excisionase family DNA binding protein